MIIFTNFLSFNWGELNLNIATLILTFIILIYIFINLALVYFIYSSLTQKNKINYFRYISNFKNKEFIIFKYNLFKLYYSILIILFIFLFKHNSFNLLLSVNNYFVFFCIILILLSNQFILFLFKIYLKFKTCINILNDINSYNPNPDVNFVSTVFPLAYSHNLRPQARKFSTKSYDKNNEPDLDNLTYKSDQSL
jgi:hypothetical protein